MPASHATAELRVRMAADAACVSGARRFVSDGLRSWGRPDLLDDATLCVSELAGNAVLHSGTTFMEIVLSSLSGGVRVSVEDDGPVPAAAVTPRPELALVDDEEAGLDDEPTTGRGLAIVSILASDWGVELTRAGKRIWAELDAGPEEHDVRPPTATDDLTVPAPAPPSGQLPAGWGLVRLTGCPVDLSLRQDQYLDEVVRELQLMSGDGADPRSQELAATLVGLLSRPAAARHTGRRVAQEAASAGLEEIDIEMAMPREFAEEVENLQRAVQQFDVLCEEKRLLTVSSPADLRELRAWMTDQVSGQLRHGSAPVTWREWQAGAV